MNRRALLNGIIIVGWGWTWVHPWENQLMDLLSMEVR
jgi:hypothetical protein